MQSTLMFQFLTRPFEEYEIKEAVFAMHPNKSPSLDGMNLAFYQHFWIVVGRDVTDACLYFLNNQIMPLGLNDSSIVLIPKLKNPKRLADPRPIALCNVIYKIMAKAMTNILKTILL